MKKTFALFVLFLVVCQSVLAGNPETATMFVSGNVTDKFSNETLAGVEVRVQGTDIVTYTDFDGNFYLPQLPVGTYTLEFHYITYTATSVVTRGTSEGLALNVAMEQR